MSGEEPETPAKPAHGGAGHRARLRQRLLEGGPEALADYEVLEYLLYGAQARGDTKPLAKELLVRFPENKDLQRFVESSGRAAAN